MTSYIELKELNGSAKPLLPSSSKLTVESPENVEMAGKINAIRLCIIPTWKKVFRTFLYIITCFLMFLFAKWFKGLYILLTFADASDEEAEWVIVYGGDKKIECVPLQRERTSTQQLKVFHYRLFKYYYDEARRVWRPAQFSLEKMTYNDIHKVLGQGMDETQLSDNTVFYGKNVTDIPRKSCFKLLFDEVLSPFYIFQVYSFIIWYLDDYLAYACVIFLFSIISVTLTLIDTIQTTSKLRGMSYYEIPVIIWRKVDGEIKKLTLNSSELIPGDLIEIPENVYMPCDAILLNGSCIMNEAMLTGESIPVVKSSLPYSDAEYNPSEDKQYTLFAGTMCIQARYYRGNAVLGLVTLTGFTTVKGELIRTMLFPKPSDFKFYTDTLYFLLILASMAICGFLIDLPSFLEAAKEDEEVRELIIIKAFEIVTITVPPALPTCMQIGISVALRRLKKTNIFCISPNKINEAGQVNVMCFDKTGTLTEDGLDLLGVRPVFFDKNTQNLSFTKLVSDVAKLNPDVDPNVRTAELRNFMSLERQQPKQSSLYSTQMFPCEQILEIMASCHSLTFVNNKLIGDPLDLKMFEATKWSLEENHTQQFDNIVTARVRSPMPEPQARHNTLQKDVGIIRKFEFSSKLQRMSVIVKNLEEQGFKMHIKGSPEKIRELCKPESVPANFHSVLEKYTEEGYRVLACASKVMNALYPAIMSAKREDLEKDFTLIGFLIMENRLKPITTSIIDTLHTAEIRTIMVTGDNVLTAISVARQCHIVAPNQRIFLGDINEKKKGKSKIVWKDFEFSDSKLNDELEPELDYEEMAERAIATGAAQRAQKRAVLNKSVSVPIEVIESGSPAKRSGSFKAVLDLVKSPFLSKQKSAFPVVPGGENEATQGVDSDAEVDPRMIDLDPPFFNMQDQENYCIAVTGKVFSLILHEVEVNKNPRYTHILKKLLRKCLVFARMHPDEKALMIKHMMSIPKNKVGMCGDGANDVGALKTANMGVSLSEAEASVAAPFTSKIQDISCIVKLLREGRSALSTSYQAFKYMALYSTIQFTSITILYYYLNEFMNWHYYHIDIVIILSLSATMAMSGTAKNLTKYKPTGRLISVQILTSVIGSAAIQIVFQLYSYLYMQKQPWFTPNLIGFAVFYPTYENTTIYLVSIFQYCAVALAFVVGKPFRKPFYTNGAFTIALLVMVIVNVLFTYNPFEWEILYDYDMGAIAHIPMDWKNKIIMISIVNSIVTIMWEKIVVKSVSIQWKKYLDKKEAVRDAEDNVFRGSLHVRK